MKSNKNQLKMDYKEFYRKIESKYFDNNFKEVIEIWESTNDKFKLDYSLDYDDKILEAIATSYYETNKLAKSLHYVNKQIQQLPKLNLSKEEETKKRRYYFLSKIRIYDSLNKKISKYRVAQLFSNQVKADDTFTKIVEYIENHYYKKFVNFNKYFGVSIAGLVFLVMIAHLLHFEINKTLYTVFNYFSILGLVWIAIYYYFPKKVKEFYLKIFRLMFRRSL